PTPALTPFPTRRSSDLVPHRSSIIDEPAGISLRMKPGGPLELGRTYTLLVTLRGHCSHFRFTPFLELAGATEKNSEKNNGGGSRSEEHTSELQSRENLV